ncbi:MAG: short chain dehydrogenase [uncultured bacterium]|nr:MAG: short chain dehydrogenase [uncultured bacterium]
MNKKIIITGASVGIGYELAKVYARAGYDIGVMARSGEMLKKLKTEIATFSAVQVVIKVCDVSDLDKCGQSVKELASELGGLDIFIANAGIGRQTPAWKSNWPEIKNILQVNVMGAIASLEAAKDIMLPGKSGQLVGITSVAGFRGLPTSSAYSTSKVALTAYLESIRLDLKKSGITVTAIHPGFIDTAMTRKNKYSMPWLLPAPKSAQMIFEAIQNKKARYVFPWQMKILVGILYHLPDRLYDFLMGLIPLR